MGTAAAAVTVQVTQIAAALRNPRINYDDALNNFTGPVPGYVTPAKFFAGERRCAP